MAPKKAKLDEAMASLKAKQDALAAAQARVAELQAFLEQLKADFDEKLAIKEELRQKVSRNCKLTFSRNVCFLQIRFQINLLRYVSILYVLIYLKSNPFYSVIE